MSRTNQWSKIPLLSLSGSVILFLLDLFTPLGVAVGVLYVICIVLLVTQPKKIILIICTINTALILIAFFIHMNHLTNWMIVTNRCISIISVWIVAYVVTRHAQLAQERKVHISNLEQKNQELRQYTYLASHDLQEPLRTINSFSDLIQKKYKGKLDEKADKYLAFISQASTRMSSLVKSLLDHSLIGRKNELVTIDCEKLLKRVQTELNSLITKTNAQITTGNLPVIKGFETEFHMLVQNLLTNAIKFCKPDTPPRITINTQIDGKYWKFSFQDNGIGISSENSKKIFTIFQRLNDRKKFEGTGIGLAHCQKIVDLHGGKIWVESKLGEGSTFHFTIPK